MAAARLSNAISSMLLISRASSMTCWPSATLSPARSSSNIIGGLVVSTARGMAAEPAPRVVQESGDLLRGAPHQAESRRHGPAQADQAGLAQFRSQPRHVEPVMHGSRAEIPQDRLPPAGRERAERH